VKIGLGQINLTVGDFADNLALMQAAAQKAAAAAADLVVFPELGICGYPPEDLLLRRSFLDAHDRALQELAAVLPPDLPALVGCVERNPQARHGARSLFNAVALLEDGIARIVARKSLLPTYDVFDEARYFEPWHAPEENLVEIGGETVGVVICEDGWNDPTFFLERLYPLDPVESVVKAGASIVVNVSASPWSVGRGEFRYRMLHQAAQRHGVRMVLVNLVGGAVDLQFDGSSMAIGPDGLAFQPIAFATAVPVVDTAESWTMDFERRDPSAMRHAALVQGIRDYCRKFGFSRAAVGISGGIDSAVVAALAVDALGAANVTGLAMPSRFSSDHSSSDAARLAENLGFELRTLPIEPMHASFEAVFEQAAGRSSGTTGENVQARIRGVLLMAWANQFGHLLLTTGNKSECAVGYCTLYGDTCGGLAVIADLWKTEVYDLAAWINRDGERIPRALIEKAPSAELKPGQLDTDSLPPYPVLDPVLRLLIEEEVPVTEVAEQTGLPAADVMRLFRMVQTSEFKRYQYAPTLRVSRRSWGGRRLPVAHRFLNDGADCP
jgi:NAD+ synthetase